MRYLHLSRQERSSYRTCILVPKIHRDEILRHYIEPNGVDPEEVIVIDLHQAPGKKKTPMVEMREYIEEELKPVLEDLGVEYLVVGDAEYFKALTKAAQADRYAGYILPAEAGPWHVAYVPNHRQVFHDPAKVVPKITAAFTAIRDHVAGRYIDPGENIIHFADYPETVDDIRRWLLKLLRENRPLAIDIEAFSLKHHSAGIGTISLAWSKHEGIAFPVDFLPDEDRLEVRAMLREFFEHFGATTVYHNIAYDAGVLVYQLFMDHLLDTAGLLYGLSVMLRDWHDTKLLAYLATNSCAGNKLSLKDQAQAFAGNYAVEVTDITAVPLPDLLRYNLVDSLSTWHVYEKHRQTVIDDEQEGIYQEVFQPAIVDIIQMQLTGMPVDMARVGEVKAALKAIHDDALERMQSCSLVGEFVYEAQREWAYEKNEARREVEKRNLEAGRRLQPIIYAPEQSQITFNPNSGPQLQRLLFEVAGLPVLERTDTKQPATGGDVLGKLQNHTDDPAILAFLSALIDFKAVDKILGSFIPAFEAAAEGPDGWHYLFGNFNLGGTVSGRLSSSDPNLQNLPANVVMVLREHLLAAWIHVLGPYVKKGKLSLGKLIKSCFRAPPGWLFCGIDFASLEDRISALTTKDPNKLKVYTDGYDGHSLRAHAYFGDQMEGIIDGDVVSINSIADRYPNLRQDSKAPTFALTYQGTYKTLMTNCGFGHNQAIDIESRYHDLYEVSDQWVAEKLDQAGRDGYIVAAFGLRVRTPLLHQVVRGTSKTPFEAEAEGRTAGNALGQSWCLLNSRAGSEFMGKVRQSEHRLDIRPCAQIHDAQYYLVRDDIETVRYANKHVVNACEWQDHPEIYHDDVKLGGEFSVFYPDWSEEIGIPNAATIAQIEGAISNHMEKMGGR